MKKDKFKMRRPDSMLLLAMLVSAAALLSTAAHAADSGTFLSKPDLGDLLDGNVTVARMGRHGPAVHMSFISIAAEDVGDSVNARPVRQVVPRPEVYLSISLPW
jgi:hypothetical protein